MEENRISFILVIFATLILLSDYARARSACLKTLDNAKRGFVTGDYIIGALFPIYTYCPQEEINEYDGLQIAEAAFFAVDLINKNKDILPDHTLGIDIRAYGICDDFTVVEQSLDLYLEAISRSNGTKSIFSDYQSQNGPPLIGIIGPAEYRKSKKVQDFLKIFQIIQISYSETLIHSVNIVERESHFYFSVIPGANHMTEAILDILVANNWTYVALYYGTGAFSSAGVKIFKESASGRGICIAYDLTSQLSTDLNSALKNVDVIVCYCTPLRLMLVYDMLKFKEAWPSKRFVVIVGDNSLPRNKNGVPSPVLYRNEYDEGPTLQDINVGEIRLSIRTPYIKAFDDYYSTRNLTNNERNPWFAKFWQQKFSCKVNSTEDSEGTVCSGEETWSQHYNNNQNPKVFYVVASVFVLAHGLHDMLNPKFFMEKRDLEKASYMAYVQRIKFNHYGRPFQFLPFPLSHILRYFEYDIFNVQLLENGSYDYVRIGEYTGRAGLSEYTDYVGPNEYHYRIEFKGNLEMEKWGKIMHHPNKTFVKNICNEPCLFNQAKVLRPDKCCWDCKTCKPLEILNELTQCEQCPNGSKSNPNKTNCIRIPIEYTGWFDAQTIFTVSVSLLSIILTAFTLYIFITYGDTPVVKSSTKELCYIMFVGIFAANLTPFVTILEPGAISCMALQALPAVSFALIYAALFVKTNRIARILAISKKKFPNMNPRFLSLKAQIMFTIILICIEVTICVFFLYRRLIEPELKYIPRDDDPSYAMRICPLKEDILSQVFAFVGILILICTYYAVKTRNLPENFNEAKFIGFAMYATILTDILFGFLVYIESDYKILALNLCASINSMIILIFLFAPKLYVILWVPEKNTRANFVTTNDIRCFIANQDQSNARRNAVEESQL